MSEPIQVSETLMETEGQTLTLETGHLAQQANGAVMASLEKSQVLVAATAANQVREGTDFFPLTVDVEERMYAAGKIPGSFFRREARAGETAILTCRLIDRSLRPSFPKGFRNETHVVVTVMGADQSHPYDVLAINSASAALSISDIPFNGPIGAVRLGYRADGKWQAHPTYQDNEECTFELVVAGRILENEDIAIMMVEAASNPGAYKKYTEGAARMEESVLAEGLEVAKQHIKEAIEIQRRLIATAGAKPAFEYEPQLDYSEEVYLAASEAGTEKLAAAIGIAEKSERNELLANAREEIAQSLIQRFGEESDAKDEISSAVKDIQKTLIREHISKTRTRVDGRQVDELRQLSADVGKIQVAHGSGFFQRGETQVLNIATLGTQRMDQLLDGIDPYEKKRFMHHYNFPPYSTGEVGFMRGPKRREIGHGALAEKAISAVLPSFEEFPYTIRLVSEVLSSNGSTSMASVCSSSLSLMDAGVPIDAAIAGIAMGLIYEEGDYITLTDILGEEDAYGDMDFKVAGTADAVTALQLDTKIEGIPSSVLASALEQAKTARLKILEVMNAVISSPRDDVSDTAPRIVSYEVPMDKVGEIIGPKGKVINRIQEETGAEITIDDEAGKATVTLSSTSREAIEMADKEIQAILNPPEAELGAEYRGEVVNITNFGAFVNILPGTDGLLHISKLGAGKRLDKVEEVLSLGDVVDVVVDDIEKGRGSPRVALSLLGEEGKSSPSKNTSKPKFDRESKSGQSNRGKNSRRGPRDSSKNAPETEDSNTDDSGVEEVSFTDSFAKDVESNYGGSSHSKSKSRNRRKD